MTIITKDEFVSLIGTRHVDEERGLVEQEEEDEELLDWPCQALHGGGGSGIYENINGRCQHSECHPRNDDSRTLKKGERHVTNLSKISSYSILVNHMVGPNK